MNQLNKQEFVLINWTYYNKYEIKAIRPFEINEQEKQEIDKLINSQEPRVKNEIERRIKLRKNAKELTLWQIKSAIETIKEEI